MLLKIFAIFVCFQLINAATDVKQCKPPAGQTIPPTEVQYHDCTAPPCLSPRGTNVTVEIKFVAEDNFDTLIVNMYASMAGMKHPYPGMDGMDGCKLLYSMPDRTPVTCPVEKGKSYMLVLIIPFKPTFPKVTAPIHIGLKDKSSNRHTACFETVIKLV